MVHDDPFAAIDAAFDERERFMADRAARAVSATDDGRRLKAAAALLEVEQLLEQAAARVRARGTVADVSRQEAAGAVELAMEVLGSRLVYTVCPSADVQVETRFGEHGDRAISRITALHSASLSPVVITQQVVAFVDEAVNGPWR